MFASSAQPVVKGKSIPNEPLAPLPAPASLLNGLQPAGGDRADDIRGGYDSDDLVALGNK